MNLTEEGLFVCSHPKCGMLNVSCLDFSPEWSFYSGDGKVGSDPTRCGMPINPLLKESSYGGKVLVGGRSSFEMRKIARYTEWLGMPYKEKAQYDEFQRIGLLGSQGGLPKIILEDAKRYHKKISSFQTFRGLNREGIMAAWPNPNPNCGEGITAAWLVVLETTVLMRPHSVSEVNVCTADV